MDDPKKGRPAGRAYTTAKHVRFLPEDEADLGHLAALWRCSESEAIRRAVRETARREKGKGTE